MEFPKLRSPLSHAFKNVLRVNLSPLLLGNERPCATSDNERRAFAY